MRIFTLIFVFTLALHSYAADSGLHLNLHQVEGDYFKVVLGGRVHHVKDFLRQDDLYAGRHTLKIYKRYKKPSYLGSGYGYKKLYQGFVDVPFESNVFARLNKHHHFYIDKIEPIVEDDCDHPDHELEVWDPHGEEMSIMTEIPDQTIKTMVNHMRNLTWDRERRDYLKSKLLNQRVRTEQVMVLLQTFTFDSYRFEAARSAKNSVTDLADFWRLEDLFMHNDYRQKIRALSGSIG